MNEETQPAQTTPAPDPASVEHAILLRHLAAVQKRCSELLTQQAQELRMIQPGVLNKLVLVWIKIREE